MSLSSWWEVTPPSSAVNNGWIKLALQVRQVAHYQFGLGNLFVRKRRGIIKSEIVVLV